MSQLPQPLVKHPANLPNPLLISATNSTNDAPFVPRKEFIKDINRIASSFSLLALSGTGFVRLYSFSATLVSALRRLFDQKSLIVSVRENAPKHFLEFSLDGKPWSKPKSITSEKLIIDILTVILHCGYVFLSPIDYGREQDDRLAIAFSKPILPAPPTTFHFNGSNASATSLNHNIRTPFAISFSSASLLRVVGPPLHSTPAVLQAVRGAWPRGVMSEKKVGDATFEFKLKGYKWFQEDTFATDSLHHILGLLSALDSHGFSLLTSFSLSNRSRVKDLWIFTGCASDDHPNSVPPTPTTANGEQRREANPQTTIAPSPLSSMAEKRSSSRLLPAAAVASQIDAAPITSSLSRQTTPPFGKMHFLKKASPKTQVPVAFVPEYPSERTADAPYPRVASRADLPLTQAFAPSAMTRSPSNPTSVGSLDMTGVGSASGRAADSPATPDVLYVADGRSNGVPPMQAYDPYYGRPGAEPPHAALVESPRTRRASLEARMALAENRPSVRPSLTRSSTLPVSPLAQATGQPQIQVHAPSPVAARPERSSVANGTLSPSGVHEGALSSKDQRSNAPRTPTPPLLTPGTFRDSAFSSVIGRQSQKIPVTWTGREPELGERDRQGEPHGRNEDHMRQPPHVDAGSRPDIMERTGPGLAPPGTRAAPASREERNDVAHRVFPTIKEQPSKEGEALTMSGPLAARRMQRNDGYREREEDRAQGAPRRRDEAGPTARGTRPANGAAARQSQEERTSRRRETAMSGWVLVNVDSSTPTSEKPSTARSSAQTKSSSQSPPGTRPGAVQHQRSSSDSRVLTTGASKSRAGNAPVAATMSAAAKTIAMIDAIGARDEKTTSPLSRIFHRAKASHDSHSISPPGTWSRKTHEQHASKGRAPDDDERLRSKERERLKGIPAATRAGDKRISIN